MITTSQTASPVPLSHSLESPPTRGATLGTPQVSPQMRPGQLARPFTKPLSKTFIDLSVIDELPVLPSNGQGVDDFAFDSPDFSTSARSFKSKVIDSGAPFSSIYSLDANTLPQSILNRIFDCYVDNLRRDASGSPFATPETLLQVCRQWKDIAERQESIWAKAYITLIDEQVVETWILRINRYYDRVQFITDINIQDQRDLITPKLLGTSADLYRQLRTEGFLTHLSDIAFLITELHRNLSRCRYKRFRLAMPLGFVEIIDQLDGDARALAKLYLDKIFHLDLRFLESLELENVGWVTPTALKFDYAQLPRIFQPFSTSLRVLCLYNCFLPKIPSLEFLYEVRLEHCFYWNLSRRQWEPVGQINASGEPKEVEGCWNLQAFTIGPLTAPITPLYLPSLRTLEIVTWWGQEATVLSHSRNLSAPNLHRLIISLPHVRFVHLTPHLPSPVQPDQTVDAITILFTNSELIKVIEAPKTVLVSILRFLYERSSPSSTDKPRDLTLCEHLQGVRIPLTGDETKKQLQDIALGYFDLSLSYWPSTYPTTRITTRRTIKRTSLDLGSKLAGLWRP